MKKLRTIITAALLVLGIGLLATPLTYDVAGAAAKDEILKGANTANTGGQTDLTVSFKTVANLLLYIIGAIAVLVIIIGGILYVTSTGDASKTKRAKDTILYAVVGLVVAILAFAIVQFVVDRVA